MKSYLLFGTRAVVVGVILLSACPVNATLMDQYKFDDTGSSNYTAVDSVNSANNGTLADTSFTRGYAQNGGALWNPNGKIGGCLQFIGAHNNGVELPDSLLGTSYTISAWINATSFATTASPNVNGDNDNVIFSDYDPAQNGRMLFEVRNGVLDVFEGGGAGVVSGGGALSTSTWYNVALTDNNKAVTLYLNGNVVNTATFTYNALANSINIGAHWPSPAQLSVYQDGFDGYIDDVRIYNTALTQSDIQGIIASAPEPSSLVLLVCGLLGLAVYAWRKGR